MCLYLSALKIIVGLYEVKKNPFNCFMLTNVIRALMLLSLCLHLRTLC